MSRSTTSPRRRERGRAPRRRVEAAARRCVLLPGDLTEARFCAELIDRTVDQLGGLDILVSNAGYQNRKQIDELTLDELERTFRTTFFAHRLLLKAAVPRLAPGSAIIAT